MRGINITIDEENKKLPNITKNIKEKGITQNESNIKEIIIHQKIKNKK